MRRTVSLLCLCDWKCNVTRPAPTDISPAERATIYSLFYPLIIWMVLYSRDRLYDQTLLWTLLNSVFDSSSIRQRGFYSDLFSIFVALKIRLLGFQFSIHFYFYQFCYFFNFQLLFLKPFLKVEIYRNALAYVEGNNRYEWFERCVFSGKHSLWAQMRCQEIICNNIQSQRNTGRQWAGICARVRALEWYFNASFFFFLTETLM